MNVQRAPGAFTSFGSLTLLKAAPEISRTAVFIHAADGGVFSYLELADALAKSYKCYGISSHTLDRVSAPPADLTGFATKYRELLASADVVPDLIVGWSSGAWLAYEVGRQITEYGATSPTIVLLDPPWLAIGEGGETDPAAEQAHVWTNEDTWRAFLHYFIWDEQKKAFPDAFWPMSDFEKAAFLLAHSRDTAVVTNPNFIGGAQSLDQILLIKDVVSANCFTALDYHPLATTNPIIGVIVENVDVYKDDTPKQVASLNDMLRGLALGDLSTLLLQGNHGAPITSPGIFKVAAKVENSSA